MKARVCRTDIKWDPERGSLSYIFSSVSLIQ